MRFHRAGVLNSEQLMKAAEPPSRHRATHMHKLDAVLDISTDPKVEPPTLSALGKVLFLCTWGG